MSTDLRTTFEIKPNTFSFTLEPFTCSDEEIARAAETIMADHRSRMESEIMAVMGVPADVGLQLTGSPRFIFDGLPEIEIQRERRAADWLTRSWMNYAVKSSPSFVLMCCDGGSESPLTQRQRAKSAQAWRNYQEAHGKGDIRRRSYWGRVFARWQAKG